MADNPEPRFAWGWILASLLSGCALIGLAQLADLTWHWPSVTVGTLTDIGAALLIAFVLFILERRFTRRITQQVRATAESVVDERTQSLGVRLDDLESRLDARRTASASQADVAVRSVSDEVTRESVANALTEAIEAGAVSDGGVTVTGSESAVRLAVEFRFGPEHITRGDGKVVDDGSVPRLRVTAIGQNRPNEFGLARFDVRWEPDMSAEDLGATLELRMKQRDHLMEAKALDLPLAIRELQRSLQLALDDQKAALGSERLAGKLRETILPDWFITNVGLQRLDSGEAWGWDELGTIRHTDAMHRSKQPPKPDGVSQTDWDYVYSHADDQRPRGMFDR